MNKIKAEVLTPPQLIFILYGATIGVGILSFPKILVKITQQDAWISTILGGVYPLYLVLICIYISQKYPNHDILFLSKKYFGNFFGSIFNLLFLMPFLLISLGVTSGYANIIRVYSTEFLSPLKLIIIIAAVCSYTAYKGISLLGRICEIVSYITFPLLILPLFAVGKSSILNILPIFGSGFNNIFKGSVEQLYVYIGPELLFLIYPYINDKNKIKSSSLIGLFLTVLIYAWVVFITVYFLSINLTTKSLWPFLYAAEIIDIPIINNFRYLFMLSWSFILIRCGALHYFAVVYILKDFLRKTEVKKIYFFIYPTLVFLSMFFTNEPTRRSFLGNLTPPIVIFVIIYISSIALLIRIKG